VSVYELFERPSYNACVGSCSAISVIQKGIAKLTQLHLSISVITYLWH